MGMWSTIKRWWQGQPGAPRTQSDPVAESLQLETEYSRWDAASDNRLNKGQWCAADSRKSINADLEEKRTRLTNRCRHERNTNPIVEGVVESFVTDVVGQNGPTLMVESDSEPYNRAVVDLWDHFFEQPEVTGIDGVNLLRRLIGQDFDAGNWLHEIRDMSHELPSDEPIKNRLLDIDPLRLQTPYGGANINNVICGVERNKDGIVTHYHIANPTDQFQRFDTMLNSERIAAEDIVHVFHSREPGQVCGAPLLSSVLQDMADLRDYDKEVLDCARSQANNGMLIWTTAPELFGDDPKAFTGEIKLKRRTAKAVPPGYQVTGQQPTQPAAAYVEFRHEKLRALGRIVHMPLLMVLLSAEDSNFSQSRIDLNVLYQRGLEVYQQCHVAKKWLTVLLKRIVLREGALAFGPGKTAADESPFLLPKKPKRVKYKWGFEPIAQAQPEKHTKNQAERIKLGMASIEGELAKEGKDEDAILDSLQRTNQKRVDRGLPTLDQVFAVIGDDEGEDEPTKGNEDDQAENQPQQTAGDAKKRKAAPV